MVNVAKILKLANSFENGTDENEPYYEPFKNIEYVPHYDLDPSKHDQPKFTYEDEESSEKSGQMPVIHRLDRDEMEITARLVYLTWFELEVKVNHLIKNTRNYMESSGLPKSIIANFDDLSNNIASTIANLKKLAIWKNKPEPSSYMEAHHILSEVREKSEIIHNELQNLSEYIDGLGALQSVFSYYLEELFSVGKNDTSEWRILSMTSRSLDKICKILIDGRKVTLNSIQFKKRKGQNWSFED